MEGTLELNFCMAIFEYKQKNEKGFDGEAF